MSYYKKAVAFIDLLGFKEINTDTGAKPTIHNLLTSYSELVRIVNDINHKHKLNCEIRIFSDSVYFSYPIENIYELLFDLRTISYEVAKKGFFFRGAITIDNIFDRNEIMYGPAIIKAYELELKIATYPRIIIDDSVINTIEQNSQYENIKTHKLILKDFDNKYFINFLYKNSAETISPSDIRMIKKHISKSYRNNIKTPNVLLKYLWLINYFNQNLQELKKSFPYYDDISKIRKINCLLKYSSL